MSGSGKACVKQPRDTAAEDALPLLQALHHTHKEATRLFLMAARLGFTDEQIAAVLRKGLPKLNETDNAFTAALEAVPAEDWCRTRRSCYAILTIMLRRACSNFIATEIKVHQLPALSQHFCKTLCILSFHFTARQLECADAAHPGCRHRELPHHDL